MSAAQVDAAQAMKEVGAKVRRAPRPMPLPITLKKFSSPTWRQVVGHALLASMFSSIIGFSIIRNDPVAVILIACASGLYISLIATALVAQRLEVVGPTIAISNAASFYRSRQFHAKEVQSIRLCFPQGKSVMMILQIYLKPNAARKWNQISLCKVEGLDRTKSINCPIYIALMEAIRQAQPGLTVQNLPHGYVGPLGEGA